MKRWKLVAGAVAALIILPLVWVIVILMTNTPGSQDIPIYKGVEHIAHKYHEEQGEWPRSYAELQRFASPDDFRYIESNFEQAGIRAKFDATAEHLKITYTGPNFTIVRYAWKEDGRYKSGPSMDTRPR